MYVTPKVAVATVCWINDGDEDVVKIDNVRLISLFYNTVGILEIVRGYESALLRLIRLNYI